MTTAAELFSLQELDQALDAATARLAEIEEALGETEELIAAREDIEVKETRLKALRSKQADQEAEIESIRAKVAKVEEKLYSGTIANPKELADFQADQRMLKGQISTLEDAALATLEEIDASEDVLTKLRAELADMTAKWEADQGQLKAEKAELEPEIERLKSQREGEAADQDRATISLYDALRKRRAGEAVARVERGMCIGCRITLPSALLKRARGGDGLVQCVSCERILLVS